MKNKFYTIAALIVMGITANAQVGIGTTTPAASSMLDITSTTKGLLMPRVTSAQRTAISTPAKGLQVFDTDTNSPWYYNGTTWINGKNDITLVATNHVSQDAGSPTGSYNVAIGQNSGGGSTSVAVGIQALQNATGGSSNVALGYNALGGGVSNSYNIGIGQSAGANITTGEGNIAIGSGTNVPSPTASQQLNIGNSIYGLNIGTATPQIGIGTTTPTSTLHVNGTITAAKIQGPSDSRFKKNIKPIENALERVMKLGGYTYDWKDASEFPNQTLGKGHDMGVIAQEVEKQFPEAVSTNTDGFKAVSYTELVPALIEAIKAQQAQIKVQEAEFKSQINALKAEVAALKK